MYEEKKDLSYWNEELKNLKDSKNFIWDYSDVSSYKKSIYKNVFDKEYGNKVSDICKNNRFLIYTFLLSTLEITLSKYMNKNRIVIGIPCYSTENSRKNVHINKLLPLMSYIDYEKTYLEYMDSVKTKVLSSYKNQAYLNPKILLENGLPNDVMELTPISICMKGIHNDSNINYICESSKNDLTFLLDPMEDKSIGIHIVYNYNKITEVTINALYESFITALKDILNNYNKKIKDIKILSEKDLNKILYEFNDTKAGYPKDKTIQELFEAQVEKTPDNIGVIFEDKKLTYRELNERANSLARVLIDKGIKPDSIVGIMVERSLEMMVGIMGILKAGGAYLPIDPNYPKERIEYMLKDSESKILLSKKSLVKNIEFNGEAIDLFNEEIFTNETSNLEKINKSNNLAYIIYTSGTTGNPKAAMIEHSSLVNRLNWMQKKYPVSERDTILQKTTYTFDVSVWEILWWSLVGAKVCMLSPNSEKDPMKIIETIDKYEVTTMHFVPSILDIFLYCVEENRNNINLSSLKQVFSSGEALNFKQVSKFYNLFNDDKKLINLYGPTEATIDVSYFDCINDNRKVIPIGKPIDNTKLYVLKNKELVPIGVTGELYISGDGLARGYVNRPELTAEKFVDNPFEAGTKMYKTGDLVKWLPDGNIEFLGRIDNQVKIRGFRIELGEIESRLLQHESIKEVAILVKENKNSEKYICAYVVSDNSLEKLNLKSYLKETLPEYMVPAYFVQLEKMPLTTNGKLNRRVLPEPNLDAILTEYETPRNEIEETLGRIWSDLLCIEKVGINDNFFDLGGHSLLAVRLLSKVNAQFSQHIDIARFYMNPSVSGLSSILSDYKKHISINRINNKLQSKFGNENRLIKYKIDNEEYLVLYSTDNSARIRDYIKDEYGYNYMPNYTLDFNKEITGVDDELIVECDYFNKHVMLKNIEKNNLNEIIKEVDNINRNLKKSITSVGICEFNKVEHTKQKFQFKQVMDDIDRRCVFDIIPMMNITDANSAKEAVVRLINSQSVFRKVLLQDNDNFEYAIFEMISQMNIDIIDLSNYISNSKRKVFYEVVGNFSKNMKSMHLLNNLFYYLSIVKSDEKSFYLIIYMDHLIADAYSKNVIKNTLLLSKEEVMDLKIVPFENYLNDFYERSSEEKMIQFKSSKLFKEFKYEISNFIQSRYPNLNRGNPIIFSKPKWIKINLENSNIEYSNMVHGFYITCNIVAIQFGLKKIPIKNYIDRRSLENEYYNSATRCNMKSIA